MLQSGCCGARPCYDSAMSEDLTQLDSTTRGAVQEFLRQVSARVPVAGAWLFGSRARGDNRQDSDADVALLLPGSPVSENEFWDLKHILGGLSFDMLLDTGVLIEALPVWEDEWDHPDTYTNPTLLKNIRRDGVRL